MPLAAGTRLGSFEILAPLGAAHEKGVVHRDPRPANVMPTKRSRGSEE